MFKEVDVCIVRGDREGVNPPYGLSILVNILIRLTPLGANVAKGSGANLNYVICYIPIDAGLPEVSTSSFCPVTVLKQFSIYLINETIFP